MLAANTARHSNRSTLARWDQRRWRRKDATSSQATIGLKGTFSDAELKRFLGRGEVTSLLSELFSQRFVDRSARWSRIDLIDMLYLACAAGHCDYVVCETRTGTQLRQIQRRQGKPKSVCTSLSSLVEALRDADATTETEQRRTPNATGSSC
jgi:hypothetical protein